MVEENALDKYIESLLFKDILPYVEVGIAFYAKCLGLLRQNLLLNSFSPDQAQQIIVTLLQLNKHR